MGHPKFLDRYLRVENNDLPARFRITKSIPVDYDTDASLEKLWALHDEGIEKYRSVLKNIDHGNDFSGLSAASPSLLDLKVEISDRILQNCYMCERRCGPDRKRGEKGFCRLGKISRYASEFLHMGEEPELVPSHTIFFTGCVFACVFCQNWDISTRPDMGAEIDPAKLAGIIDMRRYEGSRNVNFVTPTPHLHTVLRVVNHMSSNTPVIWNSNMYHSWEAGKLLEGVVDVYLGDFKYGNNECARKYSKVRNYMEVVTRNFETAYQHAEIILRHLVMPDNLECCTRPIVEWAAEHIPNVRFNLMFQYAPYHLASRYPEIDHRLTREEVEESLRIVRESGLEDILL